ncbi:glutamate-cysteine ligase family protein [Halococcus agarilyticus]|uniref:glutamate-cysteine ligase family protein n=1 Tax=Halococcus agarilyticus TaxID=1232219 RepID=UPI000677ECE5|nr:glutamate-cysteine ligase family protein [Halococcus agarilyticus]
MKIGIEAEYWVIDASGALCDGRALATHDNVEPEFIAPLIEVHTPPLERVDELRRSFGATLRTVLDAAAADGKRLVPLGTPLASAASPPVTDRGRLLERIYGEGLAPATQCAGTHVHFDLVDATRQLTLLTALDPALALVSSSPWYAGHPRGHSSRAHAYRSLCGEAFAPLRGLWSYPTDLPEWERRIETSYGRFRALAAERGVREDELTTHFRPDDAIVAPVRLRRCPPTVEWRAPDTALPSETLRLVGDVARLVRRAADEPVEIGDPGVEPGRISVPPFDELERLSQAAIGHGPGSSAVREYLERMGIDTGAYRPIATEIGHDAPVTRADARCIRLAYAERLERDVAALTARSAIEGVSEQRALVDGGWNTDTATGELP